MRQFACWIIVLGLASTAFAIGEKWEFIGKAGGNASNHEYFEAFFDSNSVVRQGAVVLLNFELRYPNPKQTQDELLPALKHQEIEINCNDSTVKILTSRQYFSDGYTSLVNDGTNAKIPVGSIFDSLALKVCQKK